MRPWDHRNFRFLFAARVADTAGNAVAPIALAFAVLDLTGSTADLGLVVGARSLAMVIFLLAGGVLADRLPRSTLLVWSNVVSAVTQLVVGVLVLTSTATIPVLIGLSLLNGGAGAVSLPASSALVPRTVPRELLQRANATISSGTSSVHLVGLVGGAGLVALIGPGWGLVVDAGSFGLTALLFAGLRLAATTTARTGSSILADLREGWSAFRSRTWVWTTVAGFLVINAAFSGALTVLGPAVADRSIGRARWGWVLASEAVGVLVTTVVLARQRSHATRLSLGMVGVLLTAPWVLALGLSPTLPVLLVTGVASGLGIGYFDVSWEVNLQANVPEHQLSRVYSFDQLGSFLAMPIGQVVVGPLALVLGTDVTLGWLAGVIAIAGLAVIAVPAVRHLPPPVLD